MPLHVISRPTSHAFGAYTVCAVQRASRTLSAQCACACGTGLTSIGVHNLSLGLVLTGLLLNGAGLTSIGVHNLSPGLVLTGLLLNGAGLTSIGVHNLSPGLVLTGLLL